MSTKDKLQIVLITYNRARYLQLTFDQILGADSPIRDFDITVVDNNSTDETHSVILKEQETHPNLKYIRNKFNVGGNANIAKALEMANNEYLWVLCDDDKYDWSSWPEVETFIARGHRLIAASNFDVKEKHRNDMAYLFGQFTFLPSIILHTSLLDDTVIRNAYDSVVFLFPHLAPIVSHVNAGGDVAIVKKSIVNSGRYGNDASLVRGNPPQCVFMRARTMFFLAGFANLCRNLNDRKLAMRCFDTRIAGDYDQRIGYLNFCRDIFLHLKKEDVEIHIPDILRLLPFHKRALIRLTCFLAQTPLQPLLAHSFIYTITRKLYDRHASRCNA